MTNLVSGTRLEVTNWSNQPSPADNNQHLLEVVKALLVPALLADLLGDLDEGGVALLAQPGVAAGDDLLPELGHFDRLKIFERLTLPGCESENWEQLLLIFTIR